MFKNLKKAEDTDRGISPLESLMIVLAGRIGVGSIAGVALAIYYGGVGSIFWIWIITLLALPITYAETTLGSRYKEKDSNNIYIGGPSYYIKKGVKKPRLASLYAILILVSYIGGFLTIQSNTITKSINQLMKIEPVIIGIVVSIITFFIIKDGIKKIATFSSKIVPFMIIIYIFTALLILLKNINQIPGILVLIIKDAFTVKTTLSGLISSILIGIQRGIFSSEAGVGTGAIASSVTNTTIPAKQGYVQMIGVYITAFLVCTSTAIIVLTSNYNNIIFTDLNGIELAQYSFNYHLGTVGVIIMFMTICLFCFSTILTGYYDGESCLKYFFPKSKKCINFLKIITIIVLFLGCITPSTLLWDFVDTIVAILAIINIYSMYKLRKEVKKEYETYKK